MKSAIFYWVCDKVACKQVNYRKLEFLSLVVNDDCDHCTQKIHEPLIYRYNKELEIKNGHTQET